VPRLSSHRRPPIGAALVDQLGTPRRIRRLGSSPRSRVWRVEFGGGPAIVKQIVGGADATERFEREATALRLAARVRPPVVPELLGRNDNDRVLVLEYLDHRGPAADWVVDYAVALARLHAATRLTPGPVRLPRHRGPSGVDVEAFLGLAHRLEVPVPPAAATELADLVARLAGDHGSALLHGDPCPGNDLHTSAGVRFVDLEQAAVGDPLVELAYLRIGFPTCWCVTDTPPELRDRAEAAYREQWRTDTGADVGGSLVDAGAGWLIQGDALVERAHRGTGDQLARAVRRDWTWGTIGARQRLLYRTAVVAALSQETGERPAVGQLSLALHHRMRRCWPDQAARPVPATRPAGS
jgi:Phosphotransferase enzyme family